MEKNMQEHKLQQQYEEQLEMNRYKRRGIAEKTRYIKQFIEYCRTNKLNIENLSFTEAERFREQISLLTDGEGKTKYNPKTINALITHLKSFYHYLVTAGRVLTNPFSGMERIKESDNIPKNILKIKQVKTLFDNIRITARSDFKFYVILHLLYATGARISEIESLTLEMINLADGYIEIKDDKERKDRKAPLTEGTKHLLELYIRYSTSKDSRYLFRQDTKQRSLNKWVNYRLRKETKRLGLPHVTCHSLRHTIGTHLLKNGADIREVQEYLGHKKIRNTEVYTRVLVEDLKKVIDRKHPREQRQKNESD